MFAMRIAMWWPLILGAGTGDLDTVARTVSKQITDKPQGFKDIYHASFLHQISEDKMSRLYRGFYAKHGRVVSIIPLSRKSDESGQFSFVFEKGVQMKVNLTITKSDPRRVIGIWFGPPTETYKTIDDIVTDVKALPGKVSFQLARLGDKMEVLYAYHPDTALAIGSTFKLYILGTLIKENTPWDKVVKVRDEYKSLPSGVLQKWPDGSPITIHTLAAQMISISDNTATDHLLHYLGRKRVESAMADLGNANPRRSWPMLTTLEMFKLKSDRSLLDQYIKAGINERRNMLRGKVHDVPRDDVAPFADADPIAVDQVEWFASASDLCRVMDWLRRKHDQTALDILAINPGLDIRKDRYDYIGYKGGSEPGVLNMTWLLKTKDGVDYALSLGWNNPTTEGTDLTRMIALAQPMIDLLAKR